jgi:hypothetical protein
MWGDVAPVLTLTARHTDDETKRADMNTTADYKPTKVYRNADSTRTVKAAWDANTATYLVHAADGEAAKPWHPADWDNALNSLLALGYTEV